MQDTSGDDMSMGGDQSPPRNDQRHPAGEGFKSPSSSISADCDLDVRYYSFRYNTRKDGRRKAILPTADEDETKLDESVDSVFSESYVSTSTTASKQEYNMQRWERWSREGNY